MYSDFRWKQIMLNYWIFRGYSDNQQDMQDQFYFIKAIKKIATTALEEKMCIFVMVKC